MTQNELMMMHTLCGELYHARESLEVARTEHNDAKALHDEIHRLEGVVANLAKEKSEYYNSGVAAAVERDEARRKLGALLLCVGFHKCYDMTHPRRGMLELQAAVKKCIDDNHIVLTEGGMAK